MEITVTLGSTERGTEKCEFSFGQQQMCNNFCSGEAIRSKVPCLAIITFFLGHINCQVYYGESSPAVCLCQQALSVHLSCSFAPSLLISSMVYTHTFSWTSSVWNLYRRDLVISNPLLDYLINLNLLPLMMELEIVDILFLFKCLYFPSDNCNHLQFCSLPTRACYNFKLKQRLCKSDFKCSFLFNRIHRLWNSLITSS